MPLHHAVLGLLAEGPSHGYELKASFEEAIGPQWGELNIGHLYQILERLMRDRLVTRRAVPQADRPDKLVYRLTRAGSRELSQWLETPAVRQGGYRDDLFLKIFVASKLGQDQLRSVLHSQRQAYMEELGALGQLRVRNKGEVLIGLLIDAAVLHTEANLRVLENVEKKLPEISGRASAAEGQEEPLQSATGSDASA